MLALPELEAIIAAPESDRVEKTESLNNTDKFSEAICAFANDMAGTQQPGIIAEAMKTLGYVNRYGYGVQRAKELLINNGNPPPVFDFSSVWVKVTISKRVE